MKRSPSEDLFRLIKALYKGEKRNFKLLTGLLAGERDKKYITLFDLIDRQEVYNEGKLVKHFGDLYGGQFSAGKNYLYKFILKSLVYYNNDPESTISDLKAQVRILVRKELYPQARKILRKATREAQEAEYFAHEHELLSLEMDILIQEQSERKLEDEVDRVSALRRKSLERLCNLDEYESLSSRLYVLMNNRNVARREQDIERFRRIADHELLSAPEKALSVRAAIEYNTIHARLAFFHDDMAEAIRYNKLALEMLEKNPAIRDRMLRRYFLEVSMLGIYLLRQGLYEEAFAELERFQELRKAYSKVRLDYFPLYFIANMTLAIQLGETERISGILAEVEGTWDEIHSTSPGWHEMLLSYLMGYFYLVSGEPAKGLRWVNLIVNFAQPEQRIYLQGFARLLMLMIHFDLGNYMVVENSLPSVQRFLEKHDLMHLYERTVMLSLRAMTRHAGTPELSAVIQSAYKDFSALAQDEYEQRAISLLDFRQWLESKLQNKTIAEIRKAASNHQWPG